MNTQRQVFEKLAKQNLGAKDKQNLGAIEDAINEVKANVAKKVNDIETLTVTSRIKIVDIIDAIEQLSQQARTLSSDTQSSFGEFETEYYSMAEELYNLGINYDGLTDKSITEFDDIIRLSDMVGEIKIY